MDNSLINDGTLAAVLKKREELNGLSISISSYLQNYATNSQPVEDDIQQLYNKWADEKASEENEARVDSRLSDIENVHRTFNQAFTTAMEEMNKKIATFANETKLMYGAYTKRIIKPNNEFSGKAKKYAQFQDEILENLKTANKNLLKFCNRRKNWAKLLMGYDIQIVA